MGVFALVLFCLLTLTCFGHSSDKHMICKDVGDVFNDVTSTDVHTRRRVGPAGKRGSKGERGFPGSKGQPGEVNNERLQEIVRAKVEEENRVLQARVDKMEAQIQNLTTHISESRELRGRNKQKETQLVELTTKKIPVVCDDGVMHERSCYWAELHSSHDTTNAEAQKICAKRGSRLADIYGKNHYDEIMNYLRAKLNGKPSILVWTGMRKIHGNNVAQLSNGTPAPYTHQRSHDWDNSGKRRTHVYLLVQSSTTNEDQGMGAISPTWLSQGALCQSE